MLEQMLRPAFASPEEHAALNQVLQTLAVEFPPASIYDGLAEPEDWLESSTAVKEKTKPHRELAIEQLVLIRLFNENPACGSYRILFDDGVSPSGTTSPGTISAKGPLSEGLCAHRRGAEDAPGPFIQQGQTPRFDQFSKRACEKGPLLS